MLNTPFTTRFLALLAVTTLFGCQQPVSTPSPFGVDVTTKAPQEALPVALTGGYAVPNGSYVPNELIVTLSDGADAQETLEGFEARTSLRLSRRITSVRLADGMSLSEAYDALAARPGVDAVSLNFIVKGSAPAAPTAAARFNEQWAHRVTGLEEYWKTHGIATASQVVVAVLDSGVAPSHPELAGRLIHGQNFTAENDNDPTDPTDRHSHGTHVSGIIGAGGTEVVGVAPDVQIIPIKVLDQHNSGTTMGIIQGMAYAMGLDPDDDGPRQPVPPNDATRIRVMNMSLGGASRGRDVLYETAITEAKKRGILVVVAAGNDGLEVAAPANAEDALSISSTSPYRLGDRIWEWLSGFSNRGERIDLAAPGGQILATLPNYAYGNGGTEDYGNMSGTSMATPYVSGVAALVAATYPPDADRKGDATYMAAYVDALKQHLFATADDLGAPGRDPKYGHGRVNVLKALTTSFAYPQ